MKRGDVVDFFRSADPADVGLGWVEKVHSSSVLDIGAHDQYGVYQIHKNVPQREGADQAAGVGVTWAAIQ